MNSSETRTATRNLKNFLAKKGTFVRRTDKRDKNLLRTIRFQLGYSYGIFMLILVLVLTACIIFFMTRYENENIKAYGDMLIGQTISSIDGELQKYEMGLQIINNNQQLLDFAEEKRIWEGDERKEVFLNQNSDMHNVLTSITNTIGNINSLGIFLNKGQEVYFLGSAGGLDAGEEYYEYVEAQTKKLEADGGIMHWAGSVVFQKSPRILLLRYLVDYRNFDRVGVLVLNLEQNYIVQLLRRTELSADGAVFLLDPSGKLIASSNDGFYEAWEREAQIEADEDIFINGIRYRILQGTSEYTGWSILGMISEEYLQGQRIWMRTLIMALGFISIALSVLMSFLLAGHLARPIEQLSNTMKGVSENRKLDVVFEDNSFYEIKELGESFVHMLRDIDELVIRNKESELRQKEAQLQALQAQINPHFLYNTLNTINYMLILEDQMEISTMVIYLGDLLRNSLEDTRRYITLGEELSLVEKYLYIQNIRFGEQIHYSIKVPEELKNCRVMRLMLQPLVENAISHGLIEKKGIIHIRAEISERLDISVSDDGCGMTQDTIDKVLAGELEQHGGRHHIGIFNVNQRIGLFYGEEYGLKIDSKPGKGTVIRIEIPVEMTRNENDHLNRG